MRDRETPISEVCDAVGVSRATLYRYLEPDGSPRRRTGQS
jgi:DNA-binding phage protein